MGAGSNKRFIPKEPDQLKIEPRCLKHRYATHGAAAAARTLLYRHNAKQQKNRGKLDVYFCPGCDGWHVGHAPKKRRRG